MKNLEQHANKYWNEVFAEIQAKGVRMTASWLEKYQTLFTDKQIENVLEIGCGSGNDTMFLVNSGFKVTATDFSETAISFAKRSILHAEFVLHDTANKFPFEEKSFDLVVASLSLHYFDPNTLKQILQEIKRMLQDNGLLVFRLNSVHDEDAQKEHPIARYFYSMEACRDIWAEWSEVALQEYTEEYYGKPKDIVEGLYERSMQ